MKKILLIAISLVLAIQIKSQTVVVIDNQRPQNTSIEILEETNNYITLKLSINSYSLKEVQTPNGTEVVVNLPEGINDMDKGFPDIPYFATSVRIPAKGKSLLEVIDTNYITVGNINIAPSKGAIKRNIDPYSVPYEYDKCYDVDAFVPDINTTTSEAFCIRDVRGISVYFFPFQYNPVQKQMKVFTDITLKVRFTTQSDVNEITSSYEKIDEFENICHRFFINYGHKTRYTQLQDGHPGRMLIICNDSYSSAMTDFITWKREKGIETEMVLTSEVGSAAENVQTYITNYFNDHSDLAYVLLVGDSNDVPANNYTESSQTITTDNKYAYLVGDDHYADVFIGRFSGQSLDNIQNMVRKVIIYEKELTTSATWLSNAYGSASNEGGSGSSGHNQGYGVESDMTHMGYIQTDLENYGYIVTRIDQSSSGSTSDVAAISSAFNNGVGLACYTGHGDVTEWASTGYTNTHVNSLTNENKFPYIISATDQNGNFSENTCFAETWLRANNNGNPTGAIAFLGSAINNNWNPPMTAQDEMIDIITESIENNIKRTIGGISFNGYFRAIQDHTGTNDNGATTADAWTIFGDPSTMFRSKPPQEMSIMHPNVLAVGQNSIELSSDADETLISITREIDDEIEIIGIGYIYNSSATIDIAILEEPCTIKLTATAYNKVTYQKEIMVIVPEGPYVLSNGYTVNDSGNNNNGAVDNGETIMLNYVLKNLGTDVANNVSMKISSTSNDVTINDDSESFGDIEANGMSTKENAFSFSVRDGIPDHTNIDISYTIVADNCDTINGIFIITANAPVPQISYSSIDDSETGNNNGRLDAGETVKLIFNLANNGHAELAAGTATLTVCDENITLLTEQVQTNTINASGNQDIEFEISVSEYITYESNICFTIQTSGIYHESKNISLPLGEQFENWESNDFNSYAWENISPNPWTIVTSNVYDGVYSAKSGAIGNNSTSELSISLYVVSNDSIGFYKMVSCEDSSISWGTETYYDYLAFYIDGEMKGKWAGTNDSWSFQTYLVPSGLHTFKWSYEKDGSNSSGNDCAWIDNIKLPIASNPCFIISTSSNNGEYGIVTGGGTYPEGNTVMLTATANESYRFVSWDDGNTDNPRNIVVTNDSTFVANFEAIEANTYTITVLSNNDAYGSVSGGGTYEDGSVATISAMPYEDYRFVQWNDGNVDNPRTLVVTSDSTFIANFEEMEANTYTITVLSNNELYGSVSGGGTYEEGSEITLTAIPYDGYRFVQWTDVNMDNPRTIVVTSDSTFIANFAKCEITYTIDTTVNNYVTVGDHTFYSTGNYTFAVSYETACDTIYNIQLRVLAEPVYDIGPNPTSKMLNINSDGFISAVEFYTTTGQLVMRKEVNGYDAEFDMEGLVDGVYILRIYGKESSLPSVSKIVKE